MVSELLAPSLRVSLSLSLSPPEPLTLGERAEPAALFPRPEPRPDPTAGNGERADGGGECEQGGGGIDGQRAKRAPPPPRPPPNSQAGLQAEVEACSALADGLSATVVTLELNVTEAAAQQARCLGHLDKVIQDAGASHLEFCEK